MRHEEVDLSDIEDQKEVISMEIKQNHVMLYMKGTRIMPMCGFSGRVIDILEEIDVEFETRDVLTDPALRQAIKEFSDWPTLPQLYIDGEFVGGCDIIVALHSAGELAPLCHKAQER
jgi:monothiol glutaredoxin